eukprot:jgi/Botrbrau1/8/Bobra.0022s0005.1
MLCLTFGHASVDLIRIHAESGLSVLQERRRPVMSLVTCQPKVKFFFFFFFFFFFDSATFAKSLRHTERVPSKDSRMPLDALPLPAIKPVREFVG